MENEGMQSNVEAATKTVLTAEDVYNSILQRNDVSKSLIEHPMFKTIFIDHYNLFSSFGSRPLELSFYYGDVILRSLTNEPKATNGYYTGYSQDVKIKFTQETVADGEEKKTCFFVRKNNCEVFSCSEYDEISHSEKLEIYSEKEQLGAGYVLITEKSRERRVAKISSFYPEICAISAIRGVEDIEMTQFLEREGLDYEMIMEGRKASTPIIRSSHILRRGTEKVSRTEYFSVNLERPEFFYNPIYLGAEYSILENGEYIPMVAVAYGYPTLRDAIRIHEEMYEQQRNGESSIRR